MVEKNGGDAVQRQGREEGRDSEHEKVCVFCEIVAGKIPASLIAETQNIVAFAALEDGYPLVVTKKHLRDIFDSSLDLETQKELGVMMTELSRVVKEVDRVTSVTIVSNNGPDAGQEISHLHVHIMPRFPGDGRIRISRGTRLSRAELDMKAQGYRIIMQQQKPGGY